MENKNELNLNSALFILFVISPITIILSGYTITVLWDWFIVTTFGMKSLNIPQAIGMGLLVTYLTFHTISKNDHSWGEKIAFAFMKPLVCLAYGWVIHLFM